MFVVAYAVRMHLESYKVSPEPNRDIGQALRYCCWADSDGEIHAVDAAKSGFALIADVKHVENTGTDKRDVPGRRVPVR